MNPDNPSPEGRTTTPEAKETRKPLSLPEILRETAKRPDLTEAERQALILVLPKILGTARELANTRAKETGAGTTSETAPAAAKEAEVETEAKAAAKEAETAPAAPTEPAAPVPETATTDLEKNKERAEKLKKELRENGKKLVEMIDVLLEKENLPKEWMDYRSKNPNSTKLRVNVKGDLEKIKELLTDTDKVKIIEQSADSICDSSGSWTGGIEKVPKMLYMLTEADINNALNAELERLQPLFKERCDLMFDALKQQSPDIKEIYFYHPKKGYVEEDKHTQDRDSGLEPSNEEYRGEIKTTVSLGIMYDTKNNTGNVMHPAKVVMSSGPGPKYR